MAAAKTEESAKGTGGLLGAQPSPLLPRPQDLGDLLFGKAKTTEGIVRDTGTVDIRVK